MQKIIGLLLISCVVLLSFPAISQTVIINNMEYKINNPQKLSGKVFYNFIYIKDTTQPDNLYKEIFELDYSKNTSLFSSYSKKLQDSSMRADIAHQFKTASDPNHVDLVIVGNSNISNDQYFTDISSSPKVYNLKSISTQPFEIIDTEPKTDWKILDSTKKIANCVCQKAIGENHGRTYIAWFCSDLPYSFGPRKLNGLPGLILEAYDENRQVVYTLNHLQNNVSAEQIGLSKDNITATQEQYTKAYEAYKKNPQAFMDAHPQEKSTGTKNPFDNIDASKIRKMTVVKYAPDPDKPLVENNPIDLK